jgi:hypothetical protein
LKRLGTKMVIGELEEGGEYEDEIPEWETIPERWAEFGLALL